MTGKVRAGVRGVGGGREEKKKGRKKEKRNGREKPFRDEKRGVN
jgi:hypothetical protein